MARAPIIRKGSSPGEIVWITTRSISKGRRGCFSKVKSWLRDEGVLLAVREWIQEQPTDQAQCAILCGSMSTGKIIIGTGRRWCDMLSEPFLSSLFFAAAELSSLLGTRTGMADLAIRYANPGCQALFAFDDASNHCCFAPDALLASNISRNPGGKQPRMR